MTSPAAARDRTAARVLLLDALGRVLLLHGSDPTTPERGSWWFTPGGGLDEGETPAQGAARELAEETGLVLSPDLLGPVVHERVAEFEFLGHRYRQYEDFFLARVDAHEVTTDGHTALERDSVHGHRWWDRAALRATDEAVFPAYLADLLDELGV